MSASNETVNLQKILFKAVNKVPSEKRFDSPSRLLPGLVGSFYRALHVHDEFHVPNVLIVLLYM